MTFTTFILGPTVLIAFCDLQDFRFAAKLNIRYKYELKQNIVQRMDKRHSIIVH